MTTQNTPMQATSLPNELDLILAKHNGELGVTWEDPDVVTPDTKAALLFWHKQQLEQAVIEARIEQSWRCRELVEANADSPDEQERYGDIVLLDVDDLKDELVQLSKPKGSTS